MHFMMDFFGNCYKTIDKLITNSTKSDYQKVDQIAIIQAKYIFDLPNQDAYILKL